MSVGLPFGAYLRRTKIVATLGPASATPQGIEKLLRAGVNVVRVNASHGDHTSHAQAIGLVRRLASELGCPVGVLLDLQGPKIRVGRFSGAARQLLAGEEFSFAVGRATSGQELPTDYDLLDQDVRVGQPLLINDGQFSTQVVHVEPGLVRCRALHNGCVESRKGINLPQSPISAPAVTPKDKIDALFGVQQQVDFIALSFVRTAADVEVLQSILQAAGAPIPIIAKIEKPQALTHLHEILAVSWGVMVARGDLGVELSTAEVPMAQKRIIRAANEQGKPVITATQMLESMTRNPQPTRAEASDVANAVLDGTDAVMLSQETAAGLYPTEAVQTMVRIIEAVEKAQMPETPAWRRQRDQSSLSAAVALAGCDVAHGLQARALVICTETGRMALLAAQCRPAVPILAFAGDAAVCNRLCLVWNVTPYQALPGENLEARVEHLDAFLLRLGGLQSGDPLVFLVGRPNAPTGSTNVMLVHRLGAQALA